MVAIDANVTVRDGVTFVAAVVTNDRSTAQRIRVENAIPGPTWPPRRRGRSWTDGTWEATLDPRSRRGFGYATPGDPVDEPLAIRAVERATDDSDRDRAPVRRPDFRPPREALPGEP